MKRQVLKQSKLYFCKRLGIINRIRKKLDLDIFEQKKTFGYKLKSIEIEEKELLNKSAIEELEEQNSLIQNVIDSSPIFIVTFVHKHNCKYPISLHGTYKIYFSVLFSNNTQHLWGDVTY